MKTVKPLGSLLALIMAAALLLSACSVPAANGTVEPEPAATAEPTVTIEPTATIPVTPTPTATPEPAPTNMAPAPTPTPEPTPVPTKAPIVHEGGPDAIGLYLTTRPGNRELVTAFKGKWVRGRDIAVFNAFASQEKVLKGDYRKVFNACWNKYPAAKDYKIGYCLSFTLKSSEVVTLNIRSPKGAPKDPKKYFYQFIEVYLYDGIHINGWYSHLVESKMKKHYLMTYIKVTAGRKISEVVSARLTAFVYKDDKDFDPDTGSYIGPTSYEISIDNIK